MNIRKWLQKNAATTLTCLGAGGVIVTIVLAVEATRKVMSDITDAAVRKADDVLSEKCMGENASSKNDGRRELPKLTQMEIIRACWKKYIPTAAVGAASLICIFGANALSRRQQTSMAAAYTALAGAFEGYRRKADAACGPGTDAMIGKAVEQEKRDVSDGRPPWNEVQTFYLECVDSPSFFERTMEQVMQAEHHLNRNFILRGHVTLNEFLSFLCLDPISGGDAIGWNDYTGEIHYGYKWVDFDHRYFETDDGLTACSIDMPFAPHPLFEDSDV